MAEERIYTDNRFPGLEVINEGTRFTVRSEGAEVEDFQGHERYGAPGVSEAFAARRAETYFNRLMECELRELDEDLANDDDDLDELGLPRDRDASFVNEPPRAPTVLTPDGVLDMWERAQAMPEGPAKEAAMAQVKSAAGQLESAAEEIVSRLLS